nr:hypothetical protein [Comamonas sp. Tr-654]
MSTTTLSEEAGGTRLYLEWRALDASPVEEALFNSSHASMKMGWSGSMQLLAGYLANVQAA